MPKEELAVLKQIVAKRSDMELLTFVTEPTQLLAQAERVIAMGGYNTVGEVLSFEKPLLVVPRVKPRLEQLIRAERMAEQGLLELLHPDDLNPETLGQWLDKDVCKPKIHGNYQFSALKQICYELRQLIQEKEFTYAA
jgi:predicted glycosyltransferase